MMLVQVFSSVELVVSHGKDVCGCLLISSEYSVLKIPPLECTCESRTQ